jgi:voltage-gated potassium channel
MPLAQRPGQDRDFYDVLGLFRTPIVAMILVNTFGVLGFMTIDGYPFQDALYQTVITFTTVGFGETHPISDAGKVFVILLITGGALSWTYALGVTINVFLHEDVVGKFREAVMENRISRFEQHFIVAGYTDIARQVVMALKKHSIPLVILDNDPARVSMAEEDGVSDILLPLSPFHAGSFRRANVEKARGIIITLPDDSDNIAITVTGKIMEDEIGRNLLIVSLANRQEGRNKLLKVGADTVIMPHELIGQRLAAMALHIPEPGQSSFLDRVAFGEFLNLDIREVVIPEGSSLDGVTIRRCGIRAAIGTNILGVRRHRRRRLILMPDPDITLHGGDLVLIMGTPAQLKNIPEFLQREVEEESAPELSDLRG